MAASDSIDGSNQSARQTQSRVAPVADLRNNTSSQNLGLDHMFSLMAEDIVLAHAPSHVSMPEGQPSQISARATIATWEETHKQLRILGFKPEHDDPWALLGLTKLEGPTPDVGDINSRLRTGRQLASLCSNPCDIIHAQAFVGKLGLSARTCLETLPAVLRERKKLEKVSCGWRWMEVCPDLLAYLCKEFGCDGWKMGLHMTNLYDFNLAQFSPHILPLSEAAQVYRWLHSPPATVASTLQGMADRKLILWAPTDTGRLNVLLNEIAKLGKSGAHGLNIVLVVPYEPMPGCDSVDLIQELWTHPLLQKKYAPMIKAVKFLTQPMRCTFTGPVGPLHHLKSLALFRLSTEGVITPPVVISWKTKLLDRDLGHTIMVDIPMQHVMEVSAIVLQAQLPGLLGWDANRRSPAHVAGAPRQVLCGYFSASDVCMIDIALFVKSLRLSIPHDSVHVGSHFLFTDETSFVIEFGEVCSLVAYMDLIQESVLVSRKKALITTMHPKNSFEPILTSQMRAEPLSAVSCIRFRKALDVPNSVWIKPALTDDQVAKARQQASIQKKTPKDKLSATLLTHLRIEGLPHVGHISVCQELMQKVCIAASLSLVQASQANPDPNEWAISYRGDGSFAQQIAVQLTSEDSLRALIMSVHGSGVRVAGRNLAVEVRSAHPDASCAGLSAGNLVHCAGPGGQRL